MRVAIYVAILLDYSEYHNRSPVYEIFHQSLGVPEARCISFVSGQGYRCNPKGGREFSLIEADPKPVAESPGHSPFASGPGRKEQEVLWEGKNSVKICR
jgi:hypothetical protein